MDLGFLSRNGGGLLSWRFGGFKSIVRSFLGPSGKSSEHFGPSNRILRGYFGTVLQDFVFGEKSRPPALPIEKHLYSVFSGCNKRDERDDKTDKKGMRTKLVNCIQ